VEVSDFAFLECIPGTDQMISETLVLLPSLLYGIPLAYVVFKIVSEMRKYHDSSELQSLCGCHHARAKEDRW